MPVDEEGEEASRIVTLEGLFSPRGVPEEVLNVSPYSQSKMSSEVLAGLVEVICEV